MTTATNVALLVRLEANREKNPPSKIFSTAVCPSSRMSPQPPRGTPSNLGPSTYGIFDTFADDAGRQAHLTGKVARALVAKASELFSKPPQIEKVDVLAAKLPG